MVLRERKPLVPVEIRFERLELAGEQRFQKGLVIEGDVVDVRERNTAGLEAILDRVARIVGIELLAGETFFLRGGHNAAIGDQRGRTVMIERGDPEDTHELVRTACR